jgi:Fe-S cluster assembly protein SufD
MTLEHYQTNFNQFQKQNPTLTPEGQSLKLKHLNRFLENGFPTKKQEAWKYTSLKPLQSTNFSWQAQAQSSGKAIPHFGEGCHLVFVNGVFNESLSDSLPEGLTLKTHLHELSADQQSFENLFRDFQEDALLDLNTAFANEGVFLEVQKNAQIEKTLHLVFVFDFSNSKPLSFFPRNHVVVNEGAELKLTETYHTFEESACFYHAVSDVIVHDNAKVWHDVAQFDAKSSFAMQSTRTILNRNAFYKNMHFSLGSQITRHNVESSINGEGARLELFALYPVLKNAHIDHNTWVHHKAPHTETEQVYKSIVQDGGRGIFNGMIQVYQEAQKTDAIQLNKNLLLGEKAEVDTKPQLLIHADDVKCAHGSTVGQVEEEGLFYLNSRGIPKDEAMKMLIRGFAEDVITRVHNSELQSQIQQKVQGEFFDF